MTLVNLWVSAGQDFRTAKTSLMRDADAAYYNGDKDRCLHAVAQLYDLCDEEFISLKDADMDTLRNKR